MKTSPITVDYISHLGSDLDVVNAARVSFDKESELETKACENIFEIPEDWTLDFMPDGVQPGEAFLWRLSEKDAKLIDYLAKHKHWSPFSHCYLKFRIKAPIFVARQLQKHTVGLAWNEVSRRYVDTEPEFYSPEYWRKASENVKQGSTSVPVDVMIPKYWDENGRSYTLIQLIYNSCTEALNTYNAALKEGVCPEQARMVLPQNTMTEWIWSGSLAAFARVVKLRTDTHSQYETSLVGHGIKYHLDNLFPVSTKALLNYD